VHIDVMDSGPGIPEPLLQQIFEPFFTTRTELKGSGLGLSVSRHLAASLGGELSAANRAGGPGARFTLTLEVP